MYQKTLAKKPQKTRRQHKNKKYLYIENAKQNEFVMDAQFWKFPQIEIWDLN